MDLTEFNALPAADAAEIVAVWAAIPAWVEAVVAARPYSSRKALADRAAEQAQFWGPADLATALAHHPRIGDRPTGASAGEAASRSEQAVMTDAPEFVLAEIAQANADYEQRFGRVLLIRAAGRSPLEMLQEARRRIDNDEASEVSEALGQLAEIAQRRLESSIQADPPHVTTHVLDAAAGTPAAGVEVVLTAAPGGALVEVARGVTDADGRLGIGPDALSPGIYTLTFDTGGYFAQREVEAFYPRVSITFTLREGNEGELVHHHVPLLLSPFSYSTYRGS